MCGPFLLDLFLMCCSSLPVAMSLLTELLCFHECPYLFFDAYLRVSGCCSSLRVSLTLITAIHVSVDCCWGFSIPFVIPTPVNLFLYIDGPIDSGFVDCAYVVANGVSSWHGSQITIVAESFALTFPFTQVCHLLQDCWHTCTIHFRLDGDVHGPVELDDVIYVSQFLHTIAPRCFNVALLDPPLLITIRGHSIGYADARRLLVRTVGMAGIAFGVD